MNCRHLFITGYKLCLTCAKKERVFKIPSWLCLTSRTQALLFYTKHICPRGIWASCKCCIRRCIDDRAATVWASDNTDRCTFGPHVLSPSICTSAALTVVTQLEWTSRPLILTVFPKARCHSEMYRPHSGHSCF